MSPEADRIAVPTNGRGPHPAGTAATPEPAEPKPSPAGIPSDEDLATAFTPKQLAVGFGIVASLVLLAAGWARRRGSGG